MSIRLQPRPAAIHGGSSEAMIDLTASLNPLGPSPKALQAARDCELGRYPEADAASLKRAAAVRHRLPVENVVPVPGASWGLWLCAVALLGPGERCLGLAPCFGEYRRFAELAGAEYVEIRARPPHFRWEESEIDEALGEPPVVCVIGNPGNPAGTVMPASRLRRLCAAHPRTCFVIDEAFAAFAPAGTSLLDQGPLPVNALIVRSLTKELALPGLRMGYVVAADEMAKMLAGILPPWPLSAPAIGAAVAGMSDTDHIEGGAGLARRETEQLSEAFARVGVAAVPSSANYLLARAPGALTAFRENGIAVRDCTSFGLPDYVRIAAPREGQLSLVLGAITGLTVAQHA